ncbi:MAG TPA: 23S rRNA (pseudouridine(1915)-N(3))-methyltransferase RlmH, partial [Burkholderiaceae bacterium]
MKLTVVAVGQRLPAWAEQAIKDFLYRFPKDFAVDLRAVRPEARSGVPVERLRAAEADRLRSHLPAGAVVVALDETGESWDTRRF